MIKHKKKILFLSTCLILFFSTSVVKASGDHFNIRDYGAVGDGETLDTKAINEAIEAASEAGGGTVYFPAGTYLSYSIRLKSNITLYLEQGCVLLAAGPTDGG